MAKISQSNGYSADKAILRNIAFACRIAQLNRFSHQRIVIMM
jgi:hypothetical protein